MIEKFKQKLKGNGQTLKWFYDNRIKGIIKPGHPITYSGFTARLNGYAPVGDDLMIDIKKYMDE